MSGEGGRPVVEAWGVRQGVASHGLTTATNNRGMAAWHCASTSDPSTVVPLVAADRLTDDALVEVLASVPVEAGTRTLDDDDARAVLAALRTHLEQTGADA